MATLSFFIYIGGGMDRHEIVAKAISHAMLRDGDESYFTRIFVSRVIDTDWDKTFNAGSYVVAEAYAILDPSEYPEVWDDMFLKKYTTALIKRQWGENMKKFGGIQLPGGVTLNGDQIFQEAVQEIAQIEEEMQMKYELPPTFMVG